VAFFIIGLLLLTPTVFHRNHTIYKINDDASGSIAKVFKGGLILDGEKSWNAWFDIVAGVFQIGGLILMIRKTWVC